jgi:hypothetical protein
MSEETPSTIGDLRHLQSDPETISGAAWRTVADLRVDADNTAPPPVNAFNEVKQPHFALVHYVAWLPLIYLLSMIPAYVGMLLLRSRGIDLFAPYEFFYWPVLWVLRNVGWARRLDDLIEPVLRRLAGG